MRVPVTTGRSLIFRLGFREADHALTFFELAAFFEEFDTFESFEDATAGFDRAPSFQAGMLTHRAGIFPEYWQERK